MKLETGKKVRICTGSPDLFRTLSFVLSQAGFSTANSKTPSNSGDSWLISETLTADDLPTRLCEARLETISPIVLVSYLPLTSQSLSGERWPEIFTEYPTSHLYLTPPFDLAMLFDFLAIAKPLAEDKGEQLCYDFDLWRPVLSRHRHDILHLIRNGNLAQAKKLCKETICSVPRREKEIISLLRKVANAKTGAQIKSALNQTKTLAD